MLHTNAYAVKITVPFFIYTVLYLSYKNQCFHRKDAVSGAIF